MPRGALGTVVSMARRITITFDNGPTPGVTGEVLDVLAEHGVRATFFVVGEKLRAPGGRACAERAASEGHWIGNHTMTHTVPFGDSDDPGFPAREIEAAQAEIGPLAHEDRLFRPYADGGVLSRRVFSPAAVEHLQRGGYTCILWNSVPRDWVEPDAWVDTAMAHVADRDWTLAVIHDTDTGAMQHLPEFLRRLADEGVEIVQEFPEHSVPIYRGELRAPLDHLMPLGPAA
jgi:peptidoglycan/xylan/chitin deacetylase (PgdA/CDA1 family)